MKIFWRCYSIALLLTILLNNFSLFFKHSPACLYYTFLIAYDKSYYIPYILNLLNIIFNFLGCIVFIFYTLNIKRWSVLLQWLFFARLLTELTGHHYEWKLVQSYFAQENYLGWLVAILIIAPQIPSYIAHYIYAFQQKPYDTRRDV